MMRDPVIVGGQEIPEEAIAAEAQHHPAASIEEAWTAAAEALVVRRLLLDEAERLEIEVPSANDRHGRAIAAEDARIDALLDHVIKVPSADEPTCRRYYEAHIERFASPARIEAEHILFAVPEGEGIRLAMAYSDARAAIRELAADPARFAEIARTRSACPSSAEGGQLGLVGPGETVAEFEAALFALDEGELCGDPVETSYGVHVIRAGRRLQGRTAPFEAVRDRIADYLEEASYRQAVAQYVAALAERAGVSGLTEGALAA